MKISEIHIVIVHPSEIVQKGIFEIASSCCDNKIFKVKELNMLKGYPNILGCYLFIVDTSYYSQNKELFEYVFSNSGNYKCLFVDSELSSNDLKTISLNDGFADICLKITKILTSFESVPDEIQSNVLSNRETEVLKLIAKGHTNKEIADALYISTHTVITHRKNITEKLNIKSISGLTVYAALKKIIRIEEINPNELI